MGVEDYNTDRDSNGAIPPGNIRSYDFYYQQLVNAIRQVMADLANWIRGPIFIDPSDPTKTVTFDTTAIPTGTNVNISIPGHDVNLAGVWDTIYDGSVSFSNTTMLEIQGLGIYDKLRINHHFIPAVGGAKAFMRVGNGTTWVSAASSYIGCGIYNTEGSAAPSGYIPAGTEQTIVDLCWSNGIAANPFGVSNTIDVIGFNKAVQTKFLMETSFYSGTAILGGTLKHRESAAVARDSLQFGGYAVAGSWSGQLLIEGRRG